MHAGYCKSSQGPPAPTVRGKALYLNLAVESVMESLPADNVLNVVIRSSSEEEPGCVLVSKDLLRLASPVFQRMLDPEQAMKEKDGVLELKDCSLAAFRTFVDILSPSHDATVDWHAAKAGLLHDVVKIAVKYDVRKVIDSVYDELAAPRATSKFFDHVIKTWGVGAFGVNKASVELSALEYCRLIGDGFCEARFGPGQTAGQAIQSRLSQAVSEFDMALVGSSYDEAGLFRWPRHVKLDVGMFALLNLKSPPNETQFRYCISFRTTSFPSFREQTVDDVLQALELEVCLPTYGKIQAFI
eukprot:jgi/Mesvir1/5481/Mv24082-RA.1